MNEYVDAGGYLPSPPSGQPGGNRKPVSALGNINRILVTPKENDQVGHILHGLLKLISQGECEVAIVWIVGEGLRSGGARDGR